jgi:hypothetical protein
MLLYKAMALYCCAQQYKLYIEWCNNKGAFHHPRSTSCWNDDFAMANAMAKGKPNSRFVCYYIIYIAERKTREGNIIFNHIYCIKPKPAVYVYLSIRYRCWPACVPIYFLKNWNTFCYIFLAGNNTHLRLGVSREVTGI